MISKEDRETLDKIKRAIEETIAAAAEQDPGITVESLRTPLRDGMWKDEINPNLLDTISSMQQQSTGLRWWMRTVLI